MNQIVFTAKLFEKVTEDQFVVPIEVCFQEADSTQTINVSVAKDFFKKDGDCIPPSGWGGADFWVKIFLPSC